MSSDWTYGGLRTGCLRSGRIKAVKGMQINGMQKATDTVAFCFSLLLLEVGLFSV
jgi:hypothetical protein